MLKPGGYLYSFDVGGIRQEADTFTCSHCGKLVVVKPKCDPCDLGGMCRLCDRLICPSCVNLGRCDPLEKKLQRDEDRRDALRSWGF